MLKRYMLHVSFARALICVHFAPLWRHDVWRVSAYLTLSGRASHMKDSSADLSSEISEISCLPTDSTDSSFNFVFFHSCCRVDISFQVVFKERRLGRLSTCLLTALTAKKFLKYTLQSVSTRLNTSRSNTFPGSHFSKYVFNEHMSVSNLDV